MFSKLLVRPKPFMNESLASYMNRICSENLCKIHWILEPYKVNNTKLYLALNANNDDQMISKIIEATGISKSELKNMTCNKFIIDNSYNYLFPSSWWLNEVKCCPLCLQEEYYHQIHWQLRYVRICLKHNLVLNSLCLCGKEIEMNELIEGVCECGMQFSNLKPLDNKNESIYTNQYRIYEALEIEQKLMENHPRESFFYGLNKEKFLFLYYLILHLMPQMDHIELLELSEVYCLQLNKVNKIKSLLIVEKILNNYPNNFYILLDFLNSKDKHVYSHKKVPILVKVCTPISLLDYAIRERMHKLFHKEIHYYLITRYDEYNKKLLLLSRLDKEDKYISTEMVEHWYSFPCNSIDSLFKIKILEESKYVEINEVSNFIKVFLKRGTIFIDEDREDFITLKQTLDYFSTSEFRLDIIIKIILEKKVEIKIYIHDRGLDMIYLHKDSAIKTVEQLMNTYREDKTL
jgi:tetratricopeptide (TPR) repeat protein